MTLKMIRSVSEWKNIRQVIGDEGLVLGFVPTMGALHEGHLSLVKKSLEDADITIVSIFVNPTQFNDPSDLEKYPNLIDEDKEMLCQEGVDYVFYPQFQDLYPDNFRYKVVEDSVSKILCGTYRQGHFNGVLSVVMKLFNIISPHYAYFGEKDYQQYLLIKDMVEAFFMDVKVVSCPIVRETSGLAMSSRNRLISKKARDDAGRLYKELSSGQSVQKITDNLMEAGFKIDYIEEHFNRRFGAVTIDNVRLIDNVEM